MGALVALRIQVERLLLLASRLHLETLVHHPSIALVEMAVEMAVEEGTDMIMAPPVPMVDLM
jgi:hypothetical protein